MYLFIAFILGCVCVLVRLEQHGPLHTLCHCGQSLPQFFTLIFNLVLVVVFELKTMPAPSTDLHPSPILLLLFNKIFKYTWILQTADTCISHQWLVSPYLLSTALPPFKNSGVIVSMPRWMLFRSEHWSCGCLELSCLWDQLSLLP